MFCGCFTCNTGGEVGRCAVIDRDGDRAAEEAAPEGGHPFGAVRAPEEDEVAGADAALLQFVRDAKSDCCQFVVSPGFAAVAATLHYGDAAGVAMEVGEEREQIGSGHEFVFACEQFTPGEARRRGGSTIHLGSRLTAHSKGHAACHAGTFVAIVKNGWRRIGALSVTIEEAGGPVGGIPLTIWR